MLPLRPDNGDRGSDLLRATGGLIASFNRFCDPDLIARFTIVVPVIDERQIASLSTASSIPLTIIVEDYLFEPPRKMPRHGWYVQQLIKIAYAKLCRTAFYLTLDADVVLLNELDDRVLADGRAPLQLETAGLHPGWWPASAAALGLDRATLPADAPVIGVTPAFVSASVMRSVIERLTLCAAGRNLSWTDYLAVRSNSGAHDDRTWTEYSLYWNQLTVEPGMDLYLNQPAAGPGPDALHWPSHVYEYCHGTNYALQRLQAGTYGGSALFGIIQSSYSSPSEHVACVQELLRQRE